MGERGRVSERQVTVVEHGIDLRTRERERERGRVSERQVVKHVNEEESGGCIVGGDTGPGAMLDRGRRLSSSGAFAQYQTHRRGRRWTGGDGYHRRGRFAWISLSSHKLQCCVLSSLGGTGDAAEQSTTKALLQQTITLNIEQVKSEARCTPDFKQGKE
eukprot:164148-Rhodomonas_salina.1